MNENPCSNQEIHVLFEHGFEPCIICMTLYTESVADQTDVLPMNLLAKTLCTVMTL